MNHYFSSVKNSARCLRIDKSAWWVLSLNVGARLPFAIRYTPFIIRSEAKRPVSFSTSLNVLRALG